MIDRDLVTTDDGRQLAFEVSGAADGFPVFLMHGTPGSKTGPKPRPILLERLGVKLICYDRPGYGSSTRLESRLVSHAAADVEVLARQLSITRFAVAGRSGGGPHALACAALLPHRVTRAAVLVAIAPVGAADLDWYNGLSEAGVEEYTAAGTDCDELSMRLTQRAELARDDPETVLQSLEPQMSPPDRRVVNDIAIRRLLHANHQEALSGGADGWVDDALAFREPWGFDLASVRCPVKLWHGSSDTFSPVNHTYWLQRQLVNADTSIEIQADAAHFGAVEALPSILMWLVGTGESGA